MSAMVLADVGTNTTLIVSSAIGAIGTVLTAGVAALVAQGNRTARRTEATVNGRTAELMHRIELLEELLSYARDNAGASPDAPLHSTSEAGGG